MDDISRGRRRDYTNQVIYHEPAKPTNRVDPVRETPEPIKPVASKKKPRRIIRKIVVFVLVIGLALGCWYYYQQQQTPVPKNLRQSISSPIYYPAQAKLPAGYKLNLTSFSSPQSGVIVYSVTNDSGQKLSFSVQTKPEDNIIQSFYNRIIPLRSQFQTDIGTAQIGAYDSTKAQSVASLVASGGSWIIVTAPANIDQGQLKQVLSALKK